MTSSLLFNVTAFTCLVSMLLFLALFASRDARLFSFCYQQDRLFLSGLHSYGGRK